jgi:hypothetical protein
MTQIFRTATSQAIQEIIQENCVAGRFGLLLNEDGLEKISHRIVDLFELTLKLRSKTQEIFSGIQNLPPEKKPLEKRSPSFVQEHLKRKNDATSYDVMTLPKKRFPLKLREKEKTK